MEKLRNNLFLASVRSRQSSLYRAQQLAEFTLYDNDPELFNTDLQTYLDVTAEQIRDSVAQYLETDDRVLLDIVPAPRRRRRRRPRNRVTRTNRRRRCHRYLLRRTKRLPVHRFQPLRSRPSNRTDPSIDNRKQTR
jgi:hypothetical protein